MAQAQKKKISVKSSSMKTKPRKPSRKKTVSKQLEFPDIPTRRLLYRPEGLQIDFKRNAEAVKPEDIVAFANGGGGTILVGVDEISGANGVQRGKVVGSDTSDRERNKVVSRANGCRPAIQVKITVETHGKHSIMRIDIPKGGLHCTSNGTYKIHRDGQNDIIDPSAMAEIIVTLERGKILNYLRSAIRPEIETQYEDALTKIEELQAELDDARDQINYDPDDW